MITGVPVEVVEGPHNLDVTAPDSHFLLHLAQRGFVKGGIGTLPKSTRKGDFSFVSGDFLSTQGEQKVGLPFPFEDRHHNGSFPPVGLLKSAQRTSFQTLLNVSLELFDSRAAPLWCCSFSVHS